MSLGWERRMFLTSVGERQSNCPGKAICTYVVFQRQVLAVNAMRYWWGWRGKKDSLVSCHPMLLAYASDWRCPFVCPFWQHCHCQGLHFWDVRDAPVEPREVSAVRAPSPWWREEALWMCGACGQAVASGKCSVVLRKAGEQDSDCKPFFKRTFYSRIFVGVYVL